MIFQFQKENQPCVFRMTLAWTGLNFTRSLSITVSTRFEQGRHAVYSSQHFWNFQFSGFYNVFTLFLVFTHFYHWTLTSYKLCLRYSHDSPRKCLQFCSFVVVFAGPRKHCLIFAFLLVFWVFCYSSLMSTSPYQSAAFRYHMCTFGLGWACEWKWVSEGSYVWFVWASLSLYVSLGWVIFDS